MEKVTKSIELAKHSAAVADALVSVAQAVKVAKADGWQPGQDIPAVLLGSTQALLSAMSHIGDLPAEAQEDAAEAAKPFALAAFDIYAALK